MTRLLCTSVTLFIMGISFTACGMEKQRDERKEEKTATLTQQSDPIWQVPKLSAKEWAVVGGAGFLLVSAGAGLLKLGQWAFSRLRKNETAEPSAATIFEPVQDDKDDDEQTEYSDIDRDFFEADKDKPFWEKQAQLFTIKYDEFTKDLIEKMPGFRQLWNSIPAAEEDPFVLHEEPQWLEMLGEGQKKCWVNLLEQYFESQFFKELAGILTINQWDIFKRTRDNNDLVFNLVNSLPPWQQQKLYVLHQKFGKRLQIVNDARGIGQKDESELSAEEAPHNLAGMSAQQFTDTLQTLLAAEAATREIRHSEKAELHEESPLSARETVPVVMASSSDEDANQSDDGINEESDDDGYSDGETNEESDDSPQSEVKIEIGDKKPFVD